MCLYVCLFEAIVLFILHLLIAHTAESKIITLDVMCFLYGYTTDAKKKNMETFFFVDVLEIFH